MNKNIFSPKGTINSLFFMIYHVFLMVLFFYCGFLTIKLTVRHNFNVYIFIFLLLFIKILLVFNYKKRIMEACHNLFLSVFLGLFFAFDTEFLACCRFINDVKYSNVIFVILASIILFIQPLIIALLPIKKGQ
jgi:hypothetical protein